MSYVLICICEFNTVQGQNRKILHYVCTEMYNGLDKDISCRGILLTVSVYLCPFISCPFSCSYTEIPMKVSLIQVVIIKFKHYLLYVCMHAGYLNCIVTRLQSNDRIIDVRFPSVAEITLFVTVSRPALGATQCHSQSVRCSLSGGKAR
jgi:hypothetical protein